MSTIKTDAITAVSTNTAITIKGLGSGVVKLGDGELKFPDADSNAAAVIGTDGSAQLSFLDAIASASSNTNLTLTGNGTGGVKINDYFIQTKGSDIASATALTLGKDGNLFDVTGTTTITSIGTQGIGSLVTLHFDGALTFTHHSTNLILPGAANITTAAGDIAVMYEYASADWRCVSYTKATGLPVIYDADTTKNDVVNTFTAAQSGSITGLTDGANISVNLALNNHYSVTLAGNRTLDNPTNIVAGTSGSFFITQDGTGSRTLSYGSYYDFAGGTAPTLTTTAAAVDRIDYIARTTTSLHCVFTGNLS